MKTLKSIAAVAVLCLAFVLPSQAQWTTSGTNIYNSNAGNVGIGTTTPQEKLHLNSGILKLTGNNTAGGPMIYFGATTTLPTSWGIEYVPSGNKGLNFWRPWVTGNPNPGNDFLFLADATGNVGIRTNNPTANLTVNGNVLIGASTVNLPAGYKLYVQNGILTEKVKVAVVNTANWADYVFAADYKLKSLKEVEKFIAANKHLPNIPSAEQVVKEGVDLGNMDVKLLEKIEELTLYLIAQDKKITSLQNQLSILQKK